MSTTQQLRGYIPRALRFGSIDTTGFRIPFMFDAGTGDGQRRGGISARMVMVTSATVRLFFTEEDYDNNQNYVNVTAAIPFDGPVEAKEIWIRAGSGTVSFVELLVYLRRG